MKLTINDVNFSYAGFTVESITTARESKLTRLEDELSNLGLSVNWANIEDIGILCVSCNNINETFYENILKVLNRLFK